MESRIHPLRRLHFGGRLFKLLNRSLSTLDSSRGHVRSHGRDAGGFQERLVHSVLVLGVHDSLRVLGQDAHVSQQKHVDELLGGVCGACPSLSANHFGNGALESNLIVTGLLPLTSPLAFDSQISLSLGLSLGSGKCLSGVSLVVCHFFSFSLSLSRGKKTYPFFYSWNLVRGKTRFVGVLAEKKSCES